MTKRQQIKLTLLKALLAADGMPMPDTALVSAGVSFTFPTPTQAEVETAVKDLEAAKFISGLNDEITGLSWTLTTIGQHRANQL